MGTSVLDRRAFLVGASAAAALAPLLSASAASQATPETVQTWQDALKRLAGDAEPVNSKKLTFELPEIAENGNMVPFTIAVDSPMTDQDHVRAIHIITTANPQPGVASFRFTPLSGRAQVASRMRLARTQEVIGLAELGDGKLIMTRRSVKVTIGGCGG